MSDSNRFHRDNPVRTGPIRHFSGLYQWSPCDSNSMKTSESQVSNGVPTDGHETSGADGIGLAYRVIEKHISDGKRNAGQFNSQPYDVRGLTDGFQELLERTVRYQSELIPLWIEAFSSALKIDPQRTPNPPGSVWRPENNGTASRGPNAISIEMASVRPVQVSLELREHSESRPLLSLGLLARDESKPRLNGVTFTETTGGSIKLRISIPDTQPPGIYSGVIVDRDTSEACGILSVVIAEDNGHHRDTK